MGQRLHSTLVYFGLVNDPARAARFNVEPMNGWRIATVAVFFVLVTALAVAALALAGAGSIASAIVLLVEIACFAAMIWRPRGN
jgi:hypothetical protein